jgi:hypothetical protein
MKVSVFEGTAEKLEKLLSAFLQSDPKIISVTQSFNTEDAITTVTIIYA